MKGIENIKVGLLELRSNKLRAALTMLGIVFGVGSVIAMLSIGEGARQETLEQIELLGTNNIIIKAKENFVNKGDSKASFSPGLNLKDANSIKDINPYVEFIAPERNGKYQVAFKSSTAESNLIGSTPEYLNTFNTKIRKGKFFSNLHLEKYSNVCVIGSEIEKELFKFEDPINKMIKINNLWFKIIGIAGQKKVTSSSINKMGISNINRNIYIPITTMMYKMEKSSELNSSNNGFFWVDNKVAKSIDRLTVEQITIKLKKDTPIIEAANLTKRILDRKHYGVNDFEIVIPEALLEQKQKTQKIFNIVMGAIAGISLLVGGIGIMNIMMSNVLERTREIGIRRAVGATKNDILSQFMVEAVFISVVGGILGIITGFFLTSMIAGFAGWRTLITLSSMILAISVSCLIGIAFGIFPAKKAAEKNPIDALRYE